MNRLNNDVRTIGPLAALFIAACATATMAPPEADRDAKQFRVPDGKTRVYVTRPGTQGGAGLVEVVIDGKIIGSLPIQSYLVADLSPGDHVMSFGGPGGMRTITIPANAGRLLFYRIRDWGLFREDTEAQGRQAVLASSRILEAATP